MNKPMKQRFKIRLAQCGINQSQLASKVGVSKSTVSDWFSGDKMPTPENVKKLAKALKSSTSEIVMEFYA